MSDVPSDAGLAIARTRLAWERTALAFAIAAAAGTAVFESAGPPAIALGLAGLLFALLTYGAAALRYRRLASRPRARAGHVSPAVPVHALTASVLVLGAACLVFVLVDAAS